MLESQKRSTCQIARKYKSDQTKYYNSEHIARNATRKNATYRSILLQPKSKDTRKSLPNIDLDCESLLLEPEE